MIELLILTASILLIVMTITGYDQYLALKLREKIVRSKFKGSSASVEESWADSSTGVKVKRVKAVKVGSYTVITLVISDRDEGMASIEDPLLLLPLITQGSEKEASITSS
ncbi:MAG: hypothetical protein DRO09_00775 [Thermoprotei archaeon]|nr:MAG: hypothetical protein DRO09_00775 [Thermoprotei archaeon]